MPSWKSSSKGEFRNPIGSSIIGIWAYFREVGLMRGVGTYRIFFVEDGHTGIRAAQALRWFKCIRPKHPAHGGVMLLHGTV